jgi:hypothetical protein
MTEAKQIIAQALAPADRRAQATPKVDYAALNRMVRRHRAALTRAVNSGDPDRVIIACRDAVKEWNQPGAMSPNDWSHWQRALDDVMPWDRRIELTDLD